MSMSSAVGVSWKSVWSWSAAEVSVTQQWVLGFHAERVSALLSCSIHGRDSQKTCCNTRRSSNVTLSQTRVTLRPVSAFRRGVLTDQKPWALSYPNRRRLCPGAGVIPGHSTRLWVTGLHNRNIILNLSWRKKTKKKEKLFGAFSILYIFYYKLTIF